MDKKEILKLAKEENRGRDLTEIEAGKRDISIATLAAYIVATVCCVVQIAAGKGINFGLYFVVNTISAIMYGLKAKRNPIWQHILSAVCFGLACLLFAVGFVISMVK